VVVCGSLYRRSRDQIRAVAEHFGVRVVTLDGTSPVESFIDQFEKELPVIIRLTDRIDPDRALSDFNSLITEKLSAIILEIRPDGLAIIGGETAFHLLQALNTTRMDVYGRMGEVMTRGVLYDGFLAGCRFVTKGGSVGSDDAVIRMIHYLKGMDA
jgi:uncharacterized protein YgbK (DUF1537 family)